MIYTFYSFKGGVGRTMALANIAELFYQTGLDVLMVDWDLEAPGVERFFPSLPLTEILDKPGLIDMLLEYKDRLAGDPSEDATFELVSPQDYVVDVYPHQPGSNRLQVLTAGRRSEQAFADYAHAVLTFDWQDFHDNWEGGLYLDWLRGEFERLAPVVLIDSRTGVTEMGGVCTFHLADVIVMLCAPNRQSIEGIQKMMQCLTAPVVQRIRGGRPLDTLIIPARIERAEGDMQDEFQAEYLALFERFVPHEKGITTRLLWKLGIPYVPKFAYREAVAVREGGKGSAEDMASAFRDLKDILERLRSEASSRSAEQAEQQHSRLPQLKMARDLASQHNFAEALRTLDKARRLPAIDEQDLALIGSTETEIVQNRRERIKMLVDELEDILLHRPSQMTTVDLEKGQEALRQLEHIHPASLEIEGLVQRWQAHRLRTEAQSLPRSFVKSLGLDWEQSVIAVRQVASRLWAEQRTPCVCDKLKGDHQGRS